MPTSSQIKKYLDTTGWSILHKTRVGSIIYKHHKYKETILLPTDNKLGDYKELISKSIHDIVRFEEIAEDALIEKIKFLSRDILRFRANSRLVINGALPLYAWEKHYDFTVRTIKVAASCIFKTTPSGKKLKPKDAAYFASRCLIGQTEIGSYVTKAMIPLGDYQKNLHNEQETSIIPFGRQLSSSIITGARIIESQSKKTNNDSDSILNIFHNNHHLATLCERMCSAYEDVSEAFKDKIDLSLSLDPSPELPHVKNELLIRPVVLSSKYINEIKELRKTIIRDYAQKEENISGFVVSLSQDVYKNDVDVGKIKIRDSDGNKINLKIKSEMYKVAIRAHDEKKPIRVKGLLKRESKKYYLEDPSDFVML